MEGQPVPDLQSLLDRNRRFAASGAHEGLAISPSAGVCVVTCLDPRTDPAALLGLELGEAAVIRNAGGRVTPAVVDDLAYIAYLSATRLQPEAPLFEVVVIHHTGCGTAPLADEGFRRSYAELSRTDEAALAAQAVVDPAATVRHDVEVLRAATAISDRVSVSGHVYDVESGELTTVVPSAPIHAE